MEKNKFLNNTVFTAMQMMCMRMRIRCSYPA